MESCWLLFENHYQPESVKLPTVTLAETASIRLAHEKHLCEYHRNHVDSEKIFNLKIQNEKKNQKLEYQKSWLNKIRLMFGSNMIPTWKFKIFRSKPNFEKLSFHLNGSNVRIKQMENQLLNWRNNFLCSKMLFLMFMNTQ